MFSWFLGQLRTTPEWRERLGISRISSCRGWQRRILQLAAKAAHARGKTVSHTHARALAQNSLNIQ